MFMAVSLATIGCNQQQLNSPFLQHVNIFVSLIVMDYVYYMMAWIYDSPTDPKLSHRSLMFCLMAEIESYDKKTLKPVHTTCPTPVNSDIDYDDGWEREDSMDVITVQSILSGVYKY